MDLQEYSIMFHVENTHWWYAGMEKITRAFLKKMDVSASTRSVLDAGCGTGSGMSTYLADYGSVVGVDISPIALEFCRKRGLASLALASVTEIPFPAESFDLVTSFDVLYEQAVPSDTVAINEFFRVLRPNGYILLRLPAYDWLRGQHDVNIHTARRYTISKVKKLFSESGFDLLHISYANTLLFPLALAKRLLERIFPPTSPSSDLSVDIGVFNGIFKKILSSEAPFAANIGLPFGLSVIALGKKQSRYE